MSTITRFGAVFEDAAVEHEYRQSTAAQERWQASVIFAAGAAAFVLATAAETLVEPERAWVNHAARATLIVALAAAIVLLRAFPAPRVADAVVATVAALMLVVAHALIPTQVMAAYWAPVNAMGWIVTMFLLLPLPLRLSMAVGLLALGGGILSSRAVVPPDVFPRVAVALTVMTLLAAIVASRLQRGGRLRFAQFRALEIEKRRAQSESRAKSEFLAMMSHEIRTPINGILGLTHLLLDRPLEAEARDETETIRSSTETLLTILNDILDFSKLEAGRLEVAATDTDLPRLVRGVVELMHARAAEKGVSLAVAVEPETPRWVRVDPMRLRQVLLNLVSNAIKFTERGAVVVAVGAGGDRLLFRVDDTGIGIAPETLPKLFSEFVQGDATTARRFGGTGLGLAICKRLVGLMGGAMTVESEPGHGSSFRFDLPLVTGAAPEAVATGQSPVSGALRILVAEDNPVNQKVASGLLRRRGHEVAVAGDGIQAVERLRAERFDLVLMDMQMPGVDGIEATRRIRALPPPVGRTPILAMTANAFREDIERCLAAGMDGHVAKPIDPKLLDAALVRYGRLAVAAPA